MTLRDFLEQHGLSEHLSAFEAQRVTPEQLSEITDADLRDVFGVAAWGDRKRFLAAAGALRGPLTLPVATPGHVGTAPRLQYAVTSTPRTGGLLGFGQIVESFAEPFEMVVVPPCRFTMGSPEHEEGRFYNETLHEVTLTRAYAIATTPVTQALWTAVMGSNPSRFKDGPQALQRPVESVSWFDAVRFCNALSAKVGLAPAYRVGSGEEPTVLPVVGADGFRLPTEVEWECAARAGSTHRYAGSDDLDAVAWHNRNSGGMTHPVGHKRANAWGLHDMTGNVWEWCWDVHDAYPAGHTVDPHGPASGSSRVLRGGGWNDFPRLARVAARNVGPGGRSIYLGVRLSRTVP